MKIYQKRVPKFHAAQFKSTSESVQELCEVMGNYRKWTQMSDSMSSPVLIFTANDGKEYSLKHRDYLVRDETGALAVMYEHTFQEQFEVAK
jgi:hypothetical protein